MPVTTKVELDRLVAELEYRYAKLRAAVEPRELRFPTEGASRYAWSDTKSMRATTAGATELGLALDDFKSVLTALRKLK